MATCAVCELHAESTFKVEGMDCREEVALIERRFKNLPGVEAFSADVMAQRLHVKYDAAKLSAGAIADAVADAGMRAWLEHEEPIASDETGAAPARRAARRVRRRRWPFGLALEFVGPASALLSRRVVRAGDRGRRPADGSQGLARRSSARRSTSTC